MVLRQARSQTSVESPSKDANRSSSRSCQSIFADVAKIVSKETPKRVVFDDQYLITWTRYRVGGRGMCISSLMTTFYAKKSIFFETE